MTIDRSRPQLIAHPESNRLWTIDTIRGFALLGILLLNINFFAMPFDAYFDPHAWLPTTRGLRVAEVVDVIGENRFMSIFAMLFGVGMVMQGERQRERATIIHVRRMLWLMLFGVIHAYIFWQGDILFGYALAGLVIFGTRKLSAQRLLWIALVLQAIFMLSELTSVVGATFSQDRHFDPLAFLGEKDARRLAEVDAMRGSWIEQMRFRFPYAIVIQAVMIMMLPGIAGLMLLGMSLYKFGFFDFNRCRRARVILAILGIGIGWSLGLISAYYSRPGAIFERAAAENGATPFSIFAVPLTAVGYISAIMILCQLLGQKIFHPLTCVGRTALTCYLSQTLICTLIFYGHGLGLFGNYDRFELLAFVVGIWIIQMILAPIWLRVFRFGPMEWIWRSLTYARLQPMLRSSGST